MTISIRQCLYYLLLTLVSLIATSQALAIMDPEAKVCDTKYALCNAAACIRIPGVSNKVLCHCSIWHGKNAGYSQCEARNPVKDEGGEHLLSTFSLGRLHYHLLTCPPGIAWASCLDQPCLVDREDPRRAYCTCHLIAPKQAKSKFVTFAGECDKKTCSKRIWSAATVVDNQRLMDVMIKEMKLRKSQISKIVCDPKLLRDEMPSV